MHTEYAEDKELIELAAKAAGITLVSKLMPNSDGTETLEFFQLFDTDRIGTWNPMTDDGDALHLAVELELIVGHDSYDKLAYALVREPYFSANEFYGGTKLNPYAATRKAITRAAAEIGRNVK